MVHQPGGQGCKQPLTYHQCQLARQLAQANHLAFNKEIDMVLDHVNREPKYLSQKFKQSIPWFLHQFYQGGHVIHQKCTVNLYNAAKQIEGFLEGRKGGKLISDSHRSVMSDNTQC